METRQELPAIEIYNKKITSLQEKTLFEIEKIINSDIKTENKLEFINSVLKAASRNISSLFGSFDDAAEEIVNSK